jgi:prepilin-type N-terminal cleavage/methylation domain-containing protein
MIIAPTARTAAGTVRGASHAATNTAPRRGFTLIETMVAVVLMSTVVLAMSMSSMAFSNKISDSSGRSRAQSMSDMQIARARAWPTYATLSDLEGGSYNTAVDGLTPSTSVVVDTTGGLNVTRISVTITGGPGSGLRIPMRRSITLAAP